MVSCSEGAILLQTPSGVIYPTADEIYKVVHEGEVAIRGIKVTSDDFDAMGVFFSAFAGEAVVELRPSEKDGTPFVEISLIVREGATSLPVPKIGEKFANYGCDGNHWIPVSVDICDSICKMFGGLSPENGITLKQYFSSTSRSNSELTINDMVPALLSASRACPAPDVAIPKAFSGTLYPYQATGFRWLTYMTDQGIPGCLLADEMGLGKTVQVICTILACMERGINKPTLIVAPATLLENWRREFFRFAPSVKPIIHRGALRTGLRETLAAAEVVITSYETLLSDISLFRAVEWGLTVLDEAQSIKNPDARRTRELKSIPRAAAIAVTGTPVENRLTDLWSIADFLLPGRLGNLRNFQQNFPETSHGALSLEPRISPFILRRRISDVATDLPPKIDIPQVVELDKDSANVYERIRLSADLLTKGSALAVLQKLRIFCAHPWLSGEFKTAADPDQCSNKLARLKEILEEIFEWHEKVLLFTSFHDMSDILAQLVTKSYELPVWQIDGRTPVTERQATVDAFSAQNGSAVLVLNPRAAGTGLNIVAANHVVHFNLEWNPAIEDQASARSFRRGQTRPVTIHRLYYSGTVEEFISSKAAGKRELAENSIVGSDGTHLDTSDLIHALSFTPLPTV